MANAPSSISFSFSSKWFMILFNYHATFYEKGIFKSFDGLRKCCEASRNFEAFSQQII